MVKVKQDMTGWKMWEHGVPESRLMIIKQVEDYIGPDGRHRDQWLCECNCENHKQLIILGPSIRSGHAKSCGCFMKEKAKLSIDQNRIPVEDKTGKRYGRLTVRCRSYDKDNIVAWVCDCDCGNVVTIPTSRLTRGITKSCGCLKRDLAIEKYTQPNKYNLLNDYGVLWTNNTNQEVLFSLQDAKSILKHTWFIGKRGYPSTNINGKTTTMHVFLGLKNHDHGNRNKLDNRRENLRPCTQQENVRNGSLRQNNTSGFTGVSWSKSKNKWVAYITVDQVRIGLGLFDNKKDAIKTRLRAEQKYFGEFAPQKHLYEEYGIGG
jgi:hypothetical protein